MLRYKSPPIKSINLLNNQVGSKIRVMRFFVSPQKPKAGNIVRIKFSVLNVTGSTLRLVPWRIVNIRTIIYSGYRFNLPAHASFDVTASWEAGKGKHFFYVDIDPQNILQEPRTKQFNNFPQGVDVIVD